ncbi:DUF2956 domain-containing protein [Shewanella dokdonensis]|uniref:DUF2956 domain-containing protein n=1 Tax=Shewanella dokdonensis TaxID=712036 RepID=A0ABX8DHB1_9GAMM|nr:DUF2956 domain-containing protein [Shewanella dokdonensis]MCL1074385.1 DUF2956 domain-containing protein [Shewanella dokdonensis]QVK24060.1 DUF2956 domain-containing protein [Shewanella dokdonensis]
MPSKTPVSAETQEQALQIARATQKPGQTKEQTRLIAQGIEKGIAEYKKQQKAKARERDKLAKKLRATKTPMTETANPTTMVMTSSTSKAWLPWLLLLLSWLVFTASWLL